jgi:hypothetical protein
VPIEPATRYGETFAATGHYALQAFQAGDRRFAVAKFRPKSLLKLGSEW